MPQPNLQQTTMRQQQNGNLWWAAAALMVIVVLALSLLNGSDSDYSGGILTKTGDTTDPYQTPFCDADGFCHEKTDIPSPRTFYSAYSKEQYDKWWRFHAQLNQTAREYATQLAKNMDFNQHEFDNKKPARPLIFYGDSITESWLGTDMGIEKERTQGVPQVLREKFLGPSSNYGFDVFTAAMGGDQTQHLLYRIQQGQLLPEFAESDKSLFVVLIGTNNLGSGELPGPTAKGVIAVADYLLEHVKGRVLLLQILPRGDGFRLAALCPPRCSHSAPGGKAEPFESFMPAVQKVNQALSQYFEQQQTGSNKDRFHLANCGNPFLLPDGKHVNDQLMPDLLHPNAKGHEILADCILGAFGEKGWI